MRLATHYLTVASLPMGTSAWWKPTPGTSYQMQLSGDLDLSYNVSMYDIDLFDTPATTIAQLQQRGIKVVCYFSAGTYEDWRADKAKFSKDMYGKGLPDWKGEYYVDTRNNKVRDIMKTRLQLAKDKGCDGVDPDNVDAYDAPSGFPLTAETQLDYNKFLADAAHALNLSVGLKNDITQTPSLVDYFDFAVNEQCIDMKTCDQVKAFVANNKPVFGVEYKGDRVAGCKQANTLNFDTLYKSLELRSERYSCRDNITSDGRTQALSPTDTSATVATTSRSSLAMMLASSIATIFAMLA